MSDENIAIEVGGVYTNGPKSAPRKVTRLGYWWGRNYHGLVYYIGRSGREIEVDAKVFAKWGKESC